MLGVINRDRGLHIRPLSDEIGERLRLDCLAWPKIDSIDAELDCPFNDAAVGFLVAENITERILSNHCYGVGLEVVVEFLRCDQDSVQQLLDLRITSLRLV